MRTASAAASRARAATTPLHLAVAANGDIILAGYVAGTIDFGLGPQTINRGQDDMFVARFEPDLDPIGHACSAARATT